MKTKSNISVYILRSSAAALLFSCMIVTFSSAINLLNDHAKFAAPQNHTVFGINGHESAASMGGLAMPKNRTLTFADRVAYQRAIEDVYWRHRIWPAANAGPKPPLEKVMSQAEIEKKVEDYLRDSQALEDYWQRPIAPDQLQAEMERIASHTKQPGVLRELFAALGNDPLVIAECVARPVLAERLVTELYAHDERFHGHLKRRADAELRTHGSVRQMKQTSGMYTEMEWIKSDSAKDGSAPADTKSAEAVKMSTSEWQESVAKLAAQFDSTKLGTARPPGAPGRGDTDAIAHIKIGVLSPLQEDNAHYYAVTVMRKGKDRLKLATIAWLKEPLRLWLANAETQVPLTMAAVSANYALPVISNLSDDSSPSVACTDNTWTPTSLTNAPAARDAHTAVWTGSEMIVWGGSPDGVNYVNTGGRYNPSTDSWTGTSTTSAPAGRGIQTAVWTGIQMIVWGGYNGTPNGYLNTGGRYNPGTNSWTATSTTGAPAARAFHTAVWTGSEMIVWGGAGVLSYLNTGGRYNPSADSWTATSTSNAPAARGYQTAVWTGSQMIVWGGTDNTNYWNTGGRYHPSADSWTATSTSNAPDGRWYHTAVWTGSQMIVWGGLDAGGFDLSTGGRYNPSADSWTATRMTGAPAGRDSHTAVWTGSEMIIWGGENNGSNLNTGGRYNPGTDNWAATSITNAPDGRYAHTAVWTGSQMIVWGGYNKGYLNAGGRYCAQSGPPPTPTPTPIPTPAVTTNPATNVASFSATLNGSLNPRGSTTTVYFQYGLTTSYGSNTPMQTQTGNTVRAISANISGLSASSTYHFRIVAHNAAGTAYGSDRTFTTLSPTGPPVALTNPASYIASFSATLNGSVDPHGLTTTIYFQYGTTTNYGLTTAPQSKTGNTYQNVVANISGLSASTTYHFRIVATNSSGTRYGSDRTFTTLSPTGPPVVITNPATNVLSSSATLNGSVDPHGLTTTVHFQYGTTTSYGHTTANQSKTGNTYQNVAANIGGLTTHTTYHFRIVATNSGGTRNGSDRTFTTP